MPTALTMIPSQHEMKVLTTIANTAASSGMPLPPSCSTPQACMVKMLYGREMGLPPMTSLYEIDLIEGTGSLPARIMIALVRRRGLGEITPIENTHEKATIKVTSARFPDKEWEFTFSLEDAKRAELLGRKVWIKYPKDMLHNRVVSQACRIVFPEIFTGIAYTSEELGSDDYPIEDAEDIEFVDTAQTTGIKRKDKGNAIDIDVEVKDVLTPEQPPVMEPEVKDVAAEQVQEMKDQPDLHRERVMDTIKLYISKVLKFTPDEFNAIKEMFKREDGKKLSVYELGLLRDHLDWIRKIEWMRKNLGMADDKWNKMLEGKGVSKLSQLGRKDIREMAEKLSTRVTPFNHKKYKAEINQLLGIEVTQEPAGNE